MAFHGRFWREALAEYRVELSQFEGWDELVSLVLEWLQYHFPKRTSSRSASF